VTVLDSPWVGPSGSLAVLAYGVAPGMELIPYFFALLAWVGMAMAGIFLWPIMALIRRLRGSRQPMPADNTPSDPTPALPGDKPV
jgi:hypothetical protein